MVSTSQQKTIVPEDLISGEKFLAFAAELKGLEIARHCIAPMRTESTEVASFELDERSLPELLKQGFNFDEGRSDDIVTLSYPTESTWWSFRRDARPHTLLLSVSLRLVPNERAVALTPRISGGPTLVAGPGSQAGAPLQPTFDGIAKAMMVCSVDSPHLKEFEENACRVLISWADLNMSGARTIETLFEEWSAQQKPFIRSKLVFSDVSPFDPSPTTRSETAMWAKEHLHPQLFEQWGRQLQEFKTRL